LPDTLCTRIRGELGFVAEEVRDPEAMQAQGYRGSRYSFGYPACADLADPKQLLALLNADEIGSTPSNRPRPSSPITPRRNTFRC